MEFKVFGPPGTGKTTYLAHQIERAVEKYGAESVMVASFTKAAAHELIRRNLDVPRENLGTLHAICYRMLGRPKICQTHKGIAEWNHGHSSYKLSTTIEEDMDDPSNGWIEKNPGDSLFFASQVLRARRVPVDRWPVAVQGFAEAWRQHKKETESIDFTDMIEWVFNEFAHPPYGIRVGFFDEVQDFSQLELDLVRKWAGELEQVVFAGDDDQTIYAFKGASPKGFLEPPVPEEQVRVLHESFRVPQAIQERSAQWIGRVTERYPKVYRARDYLGIVMRCSATYQWPRPLMPYIDRVLADGKSIMILGSCNYHLWGVTKMLREHGYSYHNPYRTNVRAWQHGEDPKIIVGTIHSVKGGEADVVVLFPDISCVADETCWWTARKDELVRTFYVGMTRAREKLVICAPAGMRCVDL